MGGWEVWHGHQVGVVGPDDGTRIEVGERKILIDD